MEMDMKSIGVSMKFLRNSKSWSLKDESEMLGIHEHTMAAYEENPKDMSIGLLNDFLEIHNISKDNFFKIVYDNSLKNEISHNKKELQKQG